MSKQKQEVISDLVSKKSLTLPTIVAERKDQELAGEARISRDRVLCCSNHNERIVAAQEGAKTSFRQVQLATLSKAVAKAFTGWTIKTQRQT